MNSIDTKALMNCINIHFTRRESNLEISRSGYLPLKVFSSSLVSMKAEMRSLLSMHRDRGWKDLNIKFN